MYSVPKSVEILHSGAFQFFEIRNFLQPSYLEQDIHLKKQVNFELDPPNNNPENWKIELGIIMTDYHNIQNQKNWP